jgi:hypothetical protein
MAACAPKPERRYHNTRTTGLAHLVVVTGRFADCGVTSAIACRHSGCDIKLGCQLESISELFLEFLLWHLHLSTASFPCPVDSALAAHPAYGRLGVLANQPHPGTAGHRWEYGNQTTDLLEHGHITMALHCWPVGLGGALAVATP